MRNWVGEEIDTACLKSDHIEICQTGDVYTVIERRGYQAPNQWEQLLVLQNEVSRLQANNAIMEAHYKQLPLYVNTNSSRSMIAWHPRGWSPR